MTFSIIIPIYNVEQYLRECLDSVVCQSIEDMDVILVDDGSTDGSRQICIEYVEKYSFIKYIRQKNSGQSSARNVGLLQAEGEYVIFLDSDDYWKNDCLVKICECLKEYSHLDIMYFDAEVIYESVNIARNDGYDLNAYHRKGKVREDTCSGIVFFNDIYPLHINVMPCMAVYHRQFLLEFGLVFPENVIYEDNLFFLQTVLKAAYIKYLPQRLYVRRYRENSTTTSVISKINIINSAKIFEMVLEFVESEQERYGEITVRKMSDFALTLAHAFWQTCSMYNGEASVLRHIKESVYQRVYLFLRRRNILHLEEWRSLILFCMYLRDDLDMMHLAEQILQKERAASLDQFVTQCKKEYAIKADEKLIKLSTFNSNKRIGIYGKGNHTKQLLHRLGHIGKMPTEVIIIDSNTVERGQMFEGYPVINIRNVPKDVEYVLISSFLYEQEMYDTAIKYLPKHIYVEKMYQDEVREICWEWMRDAE